MQPANGASVLLPRHGLVHVLVQTANGLDSRTRESFLHRVMEMAVEAGLLFVVRRENMEVYYAFKSPEYVEALVTLSVPGPHMEKLTLLPLDEDSRNGGKKESNRRSRTDNRDSVEAGKQEWRKRHDRLAAAIGLGNIKRGFEVLVRARGLVVVVIGSGRAGSWIALRLVQCEVGADGSLILVDPDVVGPENLDGMFVAHQAIGLPKVFGVGGTIAAVTGNRRIICINGSLTDPEVMSVVRTADVVFTATDEQAVRLGAAVLAARYHILHIDVTGGMAWTERRQAVTGGELRAFIPGSRGCLGCFDRYDWREAIRLLGLTSEAELERRRGLNWYEQRPGSNADILLPVIGEALQAFWGILRGEVKSSFWLHYEKDHQGRPVWADWSDRRRFGKLRKCNICGRQAGLGDVID